MPTLPLYLPATAGHNASHCVTAPGGYERWDFNAVDPATDTRIVAGLVEGPAFQPDYLKKYKAYRAAPTRRLPPVPADFPCVYAAVWRGGEVVSRLISPYPPQSLVASIDELDLRLGPNVMIRRPEGYQIELGEDVSAKLKFAPLWPHDAWEGTFPSRELAGADHRWVIAAPVCEVSGSIGEMEFNGRGFHDHWYGTGPLAAQLRRSMRGHVILRDRAIAFAVAESPDGTIEGKWVVGDSRGISERQKGNWVVDSRSPCPRMVRCGDALVLSNPQIIDSSGSVMRAVYAVQAEGEHGAALCEIQRGV